jgi:hypothetical protein
MTVEMAHIRDIRGTPLPHWVALLIWTSIAGLFWGLAILAIRAIL